MDQYQTPIQPSSPVTPIESTRAISPGLLTTLIVVVVAGAGFFGWNYMQNNKTEVTPVVAPVAVTPKVTKSIAPSVSPLVISTADWKTYTNTDYGFSVKYPADLNIKETSKNSRSVSLAIIDKNVSIIAFKTKMSLADLKKESESRGNVIIDPIDTPLNIDGADAVKYELGGMSSGEEIDVTNGTYAVSAEVYANPGSNTMLASTLEQIISTIQFTK